MSSSAAPISATADYVCIADEGSIAVLSASSLRQTSSIPSKSVISLHVDNAATTTTSNSSSRNATNVKNAPTQVTTLDVEGVFTTYHVVGGGSSSSSSTLQQQQRQQQQGTDKETFPSFMKLTSVSPVLKSRPNATISVAAASMSRPSGFSLLSSGTVASNMNNNNNNNNNNINNIIGNGIGKKPLVASALLSCGTVVHHADVSPTTTSRPKILGRHPRMAQLSNLIFAASPSLPLVVVAQPGKKSFFVFFAGEEPLSEDGDSVVAGARSSDSFQDERDEDGQETKKRKKVRARDSSDADEGNTKSSDHDDDDDEESVDLTIQNNAASGSLSRLPLQIESPVAISTITLHPTRPCLAIGGVRGEVVVIHDIFDTRSGKIQQRQFSTNNNNYNYNNDLSSAHGQQPQHRPQHQQVFIDHWHHTPVSALCFGGGQEGSILLSGASEGVVCLWNIGSNYARTNISLGSGIADTTKITAIRVASDAPSKCFVCVGDGEIQLASIDLANRRVLAKRDGLTIAYSSTSSTARRLDLDTRKLLLASAGSSSHVAELNGATLVSDPISWLGNGASATAVFLYKRTSGKLRLFDPYERRSLRSSVLTASVETIANPPTVGLQFVAASADGQHVVCFESSKERIMPPALRFLAYDDSVGRFRQVQQATDPHPGENSLVGAFWIGGGATLVTVSKQRVKVWKPLETNPQVLINPAAIATSNKNRNLNRDNENNLLMTCTCDVAIRYHPTLSLLCGSPSSSSSSPSSSSDGINCACISCDNSLLFLASDVVAAVDLRSLVDSTSTSTASSVTAVIASASFQQHQPALLSTSSSSSSKSLSSSSSAVSMTCSPTNAGSVVVAYPHAIALFGIVASSGFVCRSVLFVTNPSSSSLSSPSSSSTTTTTTPSNIKNHILAISAPFHEQQQQQKHQEGQRQENEVDLSNENKEARSSKIGDYIVALVAHEQKHQQSSSSPTTTSDRDDNVSAQLYLIDCVSCKIVAAAPWQAKYAPMSRRSLKLLSAVVDASSSTSDDSSSSTSSTLSWRCTIGVATTNRGFRTLNAVLKSSSSASCSNNNDFAQQQRSAANQATAEDDASALLVTAVPVKSMSQEEEELLRFKAQHQQERISSFFKKVEFHQSVAASSSSSAFTALATERLLAITTAEQVEKSKSAARYGKEVLSATTFFSTPSMNAVISSVFEKLESY